MSAITPRPWRLLPLLFTAACAGFGGPPGARSDDGAVDGDTDLFSGDPGSCEDTRAWFVDEVWTPALGARCVTCHVADGVAGDSALVLDPTDPAANMDEVWALARTVVDGVSVLVSKPTLRHPDGHDGGLQAPTGSETRRALEAMAARALGQADPCDAGPDDGPGADPGTCGPLEPGPRRLRRLSHVEYDHTVRDLLGVASSHGADFAGDVAVDGFWNNGDALTISPLLADQYRSAAEDLAFEALRGVRPLLPCDPQLVGRRDCASAFIVDFGQRAYRRPVTVDEHDRLLAVYDLVADEDGFEEGVRWVIAAMLQAPGFLYRSELGARSGDGFRLTGWEIASGLSYLIWQTMPDEALFAAAEDGLLDTEEGVREQVARMLADPRADGTMGRFVEAWLRLDQLDTVTRDATVYPELTDGIRQAMKGETARVAGELFRSGGTLDDLLTGRTTFLTDALAAHYGVPPSGAPADDEGFRRTDLSGTPYGGLLTQGSVLTTYANPTHPSPVHRGVMVRERLLCQPLPPPPANQNISPPEVSPGTTGRDRYDQHRADPSCSGCHDLMDPIGFGFENYDGIGRWRDDDGGLPIDPSGTVHEFDGGVVDFEGVHGLSALLAGSDDVRQCYLRQWVRFGHGLTDDATTSCRVDWLDQRFLAAGGTLADAITALVADPHFTRRSGGAGEGDALGLTGLAVPLDDVPDSQDGTPIEPGDDPGTDGLDPRLDWELTYSSDWGTGYCAEVVVTSTADEGVAWRLVLEVGVSLDNVWNAVGTAVGDGAWEFSGEGWSEVVPAQGNVGFGFCATRS